MKFKYVMITAATLLFGFASCGSEETVPVGTGEPKNVTVKIVKPTTYAEEETAIDVAPDIYDAEVFFIGSGNILKRGSMDDSEAGFPVKQFTDVPAAATEIIIVGNSTTLTSPALPTTITTKAQLEAVMFEHSVQTHAKTAVNLLGSGTITGTGDAAVNVPVRAAISRIEIGEIKAKTAGAELPLVDFKLTGIYINNAYTKVSLNYADVPTLATDILQYGADAIEFTDGSYPVPFKDEWTSASVTADASFKPVNPLHKWAYFIMPPVAGNGTTIDTEVQTSVPHIVAKLEDVTTTSGNLGFSPAYLTITKLIDSNTTLELTHLEAGKVYKITSIDIDGKDLSPKPETGARNVTVTVQVQAWVGVEVEPAL